MSNAKAITINGVIDFDIKLVDNIGMAYTEMVVTKTLTKTKQDWYKLVTKNDKMYIVMLKYNVRTHVETCKRTFEVTSKKGDITEECLFIAAQTLNY